MDSDSRRFGRPGPERALPIYTVDDVGGGSDDWVVAAVTTSPTAPDQLEILLRRLLPTPVVPWVVAVMTMRTISPGFFITITRGIMRSGVIGMMWMRRGYINDPFRRDVEGRFVSPGTAFGMDTDIVVVASIVCEAQSIVFAAFDQLTKKVYLESEQRKCKKYHKYVCAH